jgi:hypothetical protein
MLKHLIVAMPLLVAVLGVASATAQQGPDPSQYRIATNVDLVVLDVAVFDRRGRYVRDLTKDNFEVLEDGRPQSIALFRNEDIPVAAGVIVDSSGSMGPKRADTIAARHWSSCGRAIRTTTCSSSISTSESRWGCRLKYLSRRTRICCAPRWAECRLGDERLCTTRLLPDSATSARAATSGNS